NELPSPVIIVEAAPAEIFAARMRPRTETLKALRPCLESRAGEYVPSMHRKHSSNGCWSRIHWRNSGGLHRQVQKIFQNESSWINSENKGEIKWQRAQRETWKTGKGNWR